MEGSSSIKEILRRYSENTQLPLSQICFRALISKSFEEEFGSLLVTKCQIFFYSKIYI